VDELLGSLPGRTAQVVERASELADRLARAVSGVLGGLVDGAGGGMPGPAGDPLSPLGAPIPAPPPTVPIQAGGSSLAGGSFSGKSVSSGDTFEKLSKQFGVLKVLSLPFLQGGERPWFSREPLIPNSLPRPPNERPG
jgi:hypothetical protein